MLATWMVVIFLFSHQPASESSKISGTFSFRLIEQAGELLGLDMAENDIEKMAERIDYPVRKCAHMSEYAILTLLGFVTFSFLHGRRRFLIPITMTFLYACTDEIHQLFVPGRAGRFTDVLIDTTGGIIMLLFIALVTHVARKRHTAGTAKPKI